jgi:hypothetical protein
MEEEQTEKEDRGSSVYEQQLAQSRCQTPTLHSPNHSQTPAPAAADPPQRPCASTEPLTTSQPETAHLAIPHQTGQPEARSTQNLGPWLQPGSDLLSQLCSDHKVLTEAAAAKTDSSPRLGVQADSALATELLRALFHKSFITIQVRAHNHSFQQAFALFCPR